MTSGKLLLGFDRYINKDWADAALEMRLSGSDLGEAKARLREWLAREISGKETARKTATEVGRIWLSKDDAWEILRQHAIKSGLANKPGNRVFLHYGLALNIFPLFHDVCRSIGRLTNIQSVCNRHTIIERTMEKYSGLHSSQAAVYRIVQTLVDWQLIEDKSGILSPVPRLIEDQNITAWLMIVLVSLQPLQSMLVADAYTAPELLGIHLFDNRNAIQTSPNLRLETRQDGEYVQLINSIPDND